ncbi:MAG: S1/P1 nuclease [Candidatus Acidiferrales bacterium]
MSRSSRLALLLSFLLALVCATCPSARAWGCEGHQTIALIAEARLTPRARTTALKILAASPIDPSLTRYCRPRSTDPFADASTWADDVRSVRPDTARWHFIDIPRDAHRGNLAKYCPPATGCVVSALEAQVRVLKNPRASAAARADALRFVIHFVGDIHQPLHDVTNNDLGGNCVPVEFFGERPRETSAARESFSSNLHWVWDVGLINYFIIPAIPHMGHWEPSLLFARDFDAKYRAQIHVWKSQPIDFAAWAWESHALADSVAYGDLPRAIPVESPAPVSSCADDNHVGERMLRYHESLGAAYEAAAAPVVQQQLAKAGARLAAVLNSLWR